MSHFVCLVFSKEKPDEAGLHSLMLPFHEYECTGIEEYTQMVDYGDQVREHFAQEVEVVKLANGQYLSRLDDRFYPKSPSTDRPTFTLPEGAVLETTTYQRSYELLNIDPVQAAAEYFGAPYDADKKSWFRKTNPNAHWDWYVVGGRWTGMLVPNYNAREDPANKEVCFICGGSGKRNFKGEVIHCNGCNGTGISVKWPTRYRKISGDQVQRKDLQIEALQFEAMKKAAEVWDLMQEACGETWKNFLPFESFKESLKGRSIEVIRDAYWAQPCLKARAESPHIDRLRWIEPEKLFRPRADYIEELRAGTIVPFAFIDVEGGWHERGKMGWFGATSDEVEVNAWREEFSSALNSLDPEYWITVVDCHI